MSQKVRYLIVALVFGFMAFKAWQAPIVEFGDGREYVLQTQSVVFDGTLSVNPHLRGPYWNETNPYGVRLEYERQEGAKGRTPLRERDQYGGGFGALYLSKTGTYYFVHSWVYSTAVAPLYAIFHAIAPGSFEYKAFLVANLFFLFIPLILLLRHSKSWQALGFLVLMCASPLTPYLQWAHSELFCFFCVTMGFIGILSERWGRWSPLFLGLGAAQNIPILLFLPLHLGLTLRGFAGARGGPRGVIHLLVPYALAGIMPLVVAGANYVAFDTWNLISALHQADLRYLSIRRVMSVFVSPMIGGLWYFPSVWVAVLLTLCAGRREDIWFFVVSVVCVATLSSTTANINSAQLSAPRYAVWFLAPLYVLPFYAGVFQKRWSRGAWISAGVAVSLCLSALWWLGTYRCLRGDWRHLLSSPNRLRPEIAALYRLSHLHDDVEPIVESIKGQELRFPHDFRGVYVWNIGGGRSLWVISKRAYQALGGIEVDCAPQSQLDTTALSELFSLEPRDTTTFALTTLRGVAFERHPYLGSYRLLWVGVEVRAIKGRAELFVR